MKICGHLEYSSELQSHYGLSLDVPPTADKETVRSLIPRSDDGFLSPSESEAREPIFKMGKAAHPALRELLLESREAFEVEWIIYIFVHSSGEKSLARAAITEVLKNWPSQGEEDCGVRRAVVRALGRICKPDDSPTLLAMLADPELSIRATTLISLAKIGDRKAARQVEVWLVQLKAAMSAAEQAQDESIAEAEAALQTIRSRLS